ncbi:MAG: phosphodiester glycosidase family protein, partial [Clostridia bacterium]|nr:phosphodiester glycosidase family protein [Clostridia bacterium]
MYVQQYPAKDPVALVIKYIRTGVDRYNSGSWGIMAGHEDADFARFVTQIENEANANVTDGNYVAVTALKNIKNFKLPNGQNADIGHVFGSMDITYYNNFGLNHADVSGWAGDLVDLLEVASLEVAAGRLSGDFEELVALIGKNCFLTTIDLPNYPSFSKEDYDGDLDAYYIMNVLKSVTYGIGYIEGEMGQFDPEDEVYSLAEIIMNYMTEDLTDEYRAAYFMTNRLNTNGTRAQVRNAVYAEYLANGLLATLEGTRDLSGATDLVTLRRAVCAAFADQLCKLSGDYVEKTDNPYYSVFDSSYTNLAPGITQEIHYATSVDGKQMVYYIATGDITRDDVNVYANYAHNDPTLGWEMTRVQDQANAAQEKYGNPESSKYIPNYNVIASINADGFNMQTGEPGGLLIMDGTQYHGISKSGFFGITKDGKAVMGTTDDYNKYYKDQLKEAVGGFGTMLIKNGEIAVSKTDTYYTSRASRTAVGVTRTGKVVFMVLDGRQEPFSCGGSMEEIAQIMFEAGCVEAINLDGGGSTTFVAKQPGDSEISVVNRPSDGYARSVSSTLLMVSTAPSSTEFDHAVIESEYKYATIGTPVQMTGKGISPAGNETALPAGYTWAVGDDKWATISEDGVFTGLRNGTVDVYMMYNGEIIGMTEMNVVVPDSVFFTRAHMDAVYGASVELPYTASYQNKPVAIKVSDLKFSLENANCGTLNNNVFVGNEASGVKVVNITACLVENENVYGTIKLNMYKQGENTFDFGMATGGDRQFSWLREVSNSTTSDNMTYDAVDRDEKMTTSYIFAIDMTQIPIPAQLNDLIYMLPGADADNASAWNFLLQLAERVSVLTEITAIIDFDDNM